MITLGLAFLVTFLTASFALLMGLGQSHHNWQGEDFEAIIFPPTSLQLFGMDAAFGGLLLLEQVESNVAHFSAFLEALALGLQV
ncbi:MAG TPA: hypothetical protein VMN99_05670 [Anaerolineales bacterium]|nr:hypothetical protein [Anaerolineales bacterium]